MWGHSVETQSSRLQDEYLHMAAPNRVFIITGLFVLLTVPRLTTKNKPYKSLVFLGSNEGSARLKYHTYYTDNLPMAFPQYLDFISVLYKNKIHRLILLLLTI